MGNQFPFKDIQKNLLYKSSEDGSYDIFAGLIILTFGFVPILDESGMSPVVRQIILFGAYILEITAILLLKRRITWPRLGYFVLTKKYRTKLGTILLFVNILIFLMFVTLYLFRVKLDLEFTTYALSLPLGVAFMLMLSLAGIILGSVRFYLYGIVVLGFLMEGENLYHAGYLENFGLPAAAISSGSILLFSGLLVLFRFLKRYPLEKPSNS